MRVRPGGLRGVAGSSVSTGRGGHGGGGSRPARGTPGGRHRPPALEPLPPPRMRWVAELARKAGFTQITRRPSKATTSQNPRTTMPNPTHILINGIICVCWHILTSEIIPKYEKLMVLAYSRHYAYIPSYTSIYQHIPSYDGI